MSEINQGFESQDTVVLISTPNPTRITWRRILLTVHAGEILISNAKKAEKSSPALATGASSLSSTSYSVVSTCDTGEGDTAVLISTPNPTRRDNWRRILLTMQACRNIISSANKAKKSSVAAGASSLSSTSYSVVSICGTGDGEQSLQTRAAGEVAEISPHVSLQINSEGSENRNCSILDVVARMVKDKDLALLNKLGGVSGIESALRTHLESDNFRQSRPNTYGDPQFPEQGFFHFLSKACNDCTLVLLILCAVLSLGFEIKEEGPKNGWYDGVAIFLAVLVYVSINSVGNWWQARKMKKQSERKKITCEIFIRDEETQNIPISNVKVGNIICLTMGDQVPADGLFVGGESLILDDMPDSTIDAQNPFVLSGREVIKGQGRMLATSVGKNTAWSEMMSQETHAPNKKTPLQAQLDKMNKRIQIISLLVSAIILVVLFLRYKFGKIDDENGRPEIRGKPTASREIMNAMQRIIIRPKGPISTLATSLAVCLVGLQEGLSFVLTLSIAYWNKKAASNKATVQELLACVNMGSVTIICTEKIGGPMMNQMEVDIFKIGEEIISEETEVDSAVREALCRGISTLVMMPPTSHSSIENSLIHWAESKFFPEMERSKQSCTIIKAKRSNSDRESCCILMKKSGDNGENMFLHWKGHAATILDNCSHYYDRKGQIKAIDDQRRMEFQQMIGDTKDKYPKTIALACRQTDNEVLEENNFTLIGLLRLKKKGGYLEETKQVLEAFKNAGVDIKLVSGDNVAYREIIADECGMLTPINSDRMKIEDEKFRNCTDEERKEMVDRITVTENANPFDKVLLVRDLRQKGHVVAVVGVGTNDMPALKEADVGLTMGTGSTKMARDSSAIIWDGSFEYLVKFSKYGRCVYNNIPKFIQVELTMLIAGLLIIFITVISFGDAPITTIELFWVNLIVAFLGGLALLTEPGTEKLMDKPPVSQAEPLITKAMWRNIVIQVLYQTTILVSFQFEGQAVLGINDGVCKTMIFNSFVLCQVFNKFNARELEKNVFKGIKQNYLFWVAVGTGVVLQVAFIEIAGIVSVTAKLNFVHWLICFLIGMVSWVIDWAGKCIWYFMTEWIIRPLSSQIGFIRMRSLTPSESASVLELPLINNGESRANPLPI